MVSCTSLVLALGFPNIVIHFRQSADIKAIHSHAQKVKSFLDPTKNVLSNLLLAFHLSIVVINLRQYACSTIYSSTLPEHSQEDPQQPRSCLRLHDFFL